MVSHIAKSTLRILRIRPIVEEVFRPVGRPDAYSS
jgi:hypothetical protein